MMQPMGRKVLIQPIEPEDVSDAGIILVRDGREPDTIGRIVQVGPQAGREWAAGLAELRDVVDAYLVWFAPDLSALAERAQRALEQTARLVPEVELRIGQTVLLPPDRGHEVTLDGTRYLLLADTDILAVLEQELEDVTHG